MVGDLKSKGVCSKGKGFQVSVSKTQAGSKIASLGLRANVDDRVLDVVPQKAAALAADAASLLREAVPGKSIPFKRLERFTGRVNYVAQVAPELKVDLRFAHAVLKGGRKRRGNSKFMRGVIQGALKVGGAKRGKPSAAWGGLRRLFATIKHTVKSFSVPLAPAGRFMTPAEGAVVVHTDANREDGCGGWLVQKLPIGQWRLWTFEAPWPKDVRAALLADRISMPAGELVGAVLGKMMAEEVAKASAVILVTDCMPVEGAINAQSSPSPQLHEVVRALYATRKPTQALAVHVKREENQLADDLSKQLGESVRQRARRAGLEVAEWQSADRIREVWRVVRRAERLPQAP